MGGAHPHHDVDRWWDEAAPGPPSRTVRRDRWIGLASLVAAFVVFELTANVALTTAVGCLKFGWDEFRTSRYLKRRDPDRVRGRVVARFYLAAAIWRVSLVAVSLLIGVACFVEVIRSPLWGPGRGAIAPAPVLLDFFLGAGLTALAGFVLSALVVVVAALAAVSRRVPVWLGREASTACDQDLWPPRTDPHRKWKIDHLELLIGSGLLTMLATGFLIAFAVVSLTDLKANHWVMVLMVLSLVVGPLFSLIPLRWLKTRIFAASPEVCWGPVREVDHARA